MFNIILNTLFISILFFCSLIVRETVSSDQSSIEWSRIKQTPPSTQEFYKTALSDFSQTLTKDQPVLLISYDVSKSASYLIVFHNKNLIYRFHFGKGLYFYSHKTNTWFYQNNNDAEFFVVNTPNKSTTSLISSSKGPGLMKYHIKNHLWEIESFYDTQTFGLLALKHSSQQVVSFYQKYLDTTAASPLYDLFSLEQIIPKTQVTMKKTAMNLEGKVYRIETFSKLSYYSSFHELRLDIDINFIDKKKIYPNQKIRSCLALGC